MHTNHRHPHLPLRLAISLLLVAVFIAAAAPQPVQAQTQANCRTFYTVKEGDTTPFIAHTFRVKWREIASANDLRVGVKPKEGTRLCIPFASEDDDENGGVRQTVPENDPNARFSVRVSGGRITVILDRFSEEHEFKVKVRDVDVGIGGWENLGTISIDDDDENRFTYSTPSDLRGAFFLRICLKDQRTDELHCRIAPNA